MARYVHIVLSNPFINISCKTNDCHVTTTINEDGFEEEEENISIDIVVQNILSSKQIYNYIENVITMALGEDFKLLGLSKTFIVKN